MKVLTFIASVAHLAAVLSVPLSAQSGGVKSLTDGCVNATVINTPAQDFTKRQNRQALSAVINSIDGVVEEYGGHDRGQFTQDVVHALWNKNNNYNYIICHVNHDYAFQGTQGVDWDHHEVTVSPGSSASSYGYDIVVGGAGTFIREGDGGYINWAYIGNAISSMELPSNVVLVVFGPA